VGQDGISPIYQNHNGMVQIIPIGGYFLTCELGHWKDLTQS
jgi:hypothetical protein